MKMDIHDVFPTACGGLADKMPEEKTRFERLEAECVEGRLDAHGNLCILMAEHIDILDKGAADGFVGVLRAGGFALGRFGGLPKGGQKKMTRALTLQRPRPFSSVGPD